MNLSLTGPQQHDAIELPPTYNYIGLFLSFRCPYGCSYCINRQDTVPHSGSELTGDQWLTFLRRLRTRDVPVTFQGGEPGCHPEFIGLVRDTLRLHPVDILTNLAFDIDEFARQVPAQAINRDAPYAPIRVSYHPEQFTLEHILERVLMMQQYGYRIGLYGIDHPAHAYAMVRAAAICRESGVDFRMKSFLGQHNGRTYGELAYPDACWQSQAGTCECTPSELLIAPDGGIFPCHHHLYSRIGEISRVTQRHVALTELPQPCNSFGHCNPCDIKVKNNRFQQHGHVSVQIRLRDKAA